ncbi:hypothetical protein BCR44DRAFT_1461926 [Catenaria anguillulae PL171]|uniref:Uncharacterized protein n=1 Tax=Catenaria anguillulae PL171 TaxID=765915 RepID=A0A1Y2HIE6_9FUNG|nr:hypothetical protein BCR44DRAFT_1461926 [Catenaria anguillulae PL171]
MAKLGPSPTDDDSPSAAARRRRQRIVNGLMFESRQLKRRLIILWQCSIARVCIVATAQRRPPPKEATVSLVARGKPGFKSLLARMKGKKPDLAAPVSVGAPPAQQPAPYHPTSTPQKPSFSSLDLAATPLVGPSTPRDRVFARVETPGSVSVKRSARKLGASVKSIFTPFKELKEVAAELEGDEPGIGDNVDRMEM